STNFLPCYLIRDKTSMRYQTHYQLKQKLWLEPFGNRQAIGGNELNPQRLIPSIPLGLWQ
ncbi:TPA: hypothetical protein ACL2D0_001551, partial [Streptococcus pneumoniae]